MVQTKFEKYDALVLVFISLLFALFLYQLKSALIPPVLTIVLVALLLPLREHPLVRNLIYAIIAIFFFWFMLDNKAIITPFLIALTLAYLFDPLVTKLEKRKIPRWASVSVIVILTVGSISVTLYFMIPRMIDELGHLLVFFLGLPGRFAEWMKTDGAEFFTGLNIDPKRVEEFVSTKLPAKYNQWLEAALNWVLSFPKHAPRLIGQVLYGVLIPFLFFYILKDFDKVRRWTKELLPIESSWVVRDYLERINGIISGFFRGQLIVCFLVGILSTLALLALRAPYAILLGLLAGALNIVPYVGLAITLFVGLLVGITGPDPILTCTKIILAIESVRILESSFIAPRIVGDRVGLHPVWVIFSILIFANQLGVLGLIIAVPLAATIKIFISIGVRSYRRKIWRRPMRKHENNNR
jgi:predicted PurR-regulated permease PerM